MRNRCEQFVESPEATGYVSRDIQYENGVLVGLLLEETMEVRALQRE
jgi:hypothetical protein